MFIRIPAVLPCMAAAYVLAVSGRSCPGQAIFAGLGVTPGYARSLAQALSADGSTVVGHSETLDAYSQVTAAAAWYWTAGTGMVTLNVGDSAQPTTSLAEVLSAGLMFVGQVAGPGGGTGFVQLSGLTSFLTDPASPAGTRAIGAAAGGTIILGNSHSTITYPWGPYVAPRPCYWTKQGDSWQIAYLPDFDSEIEGEATAGSADGGVLVGRGSPDGYSEAAAWVRQSDGRYEISGLGDASGGGLNSIAVGVTPNDATIIGNGMRSCGPEALYWTRAGNGQYDILALGDLDGGSFNSAVYGVSADGYFVVGHGTSAQGQQAILWDPGHGMRLLQDVLIENGLGGALAGWTLREATDISADGRTFVGYGINPAGQTEAWIATIPEPASVILLLAGVVGFARSRRRSTR